VAAVGGVIQVLVAHAQVQAELERRYSKELIDVVQEAPAVPAAS